MSKAITEAIQRIIRDTYGVEVEPVLTRPDPQFGDYACNVALQLSKQLGKNPREIGQEIADKITTITEVQNAEIAGPGFVNIRLTDAALMASVAAPLARPYEGQTIVIETNNPNPFKAMHIGHAFNAILADAISRLLEAGGAEVKRVSYHGDVGLHVGKSMYALLKFVDGDVQKLQSIPAAEHNSFMSKMYAEGARAYKEDDEAKTAIAELAKQSFTRTDPTYAAVYDTIFAWSFEELAKTLDRLGNAPTIRKFLESEADPIGVQTVRDHVPGVFQESDGALIFKGSEHGGFDNAFVGSNGLGLYAARDLGLIQLKNEAFHPDKSYMVTAEEQRDYFKGVLAAAAQIWPDMQDLTVNISTGTLKLTTGKMSSRNGEVIEIAWLFDQVAEAVKARGGEVSDMVVAGALRYAFLRVRIGGDVIFDINESVSIQGNSGPYLQYAHARACSILRKVDGTHALESSSQFDANERALLSKITEYNEVVEKATLELMPHSICNYLYELAQAFNRFYESSRIVGDERETVRLGLATLYRDTLAHGLGILGIDAPDSM